MVPIDGTPSVFNRFALEETHKPGPRKTPQDLGRVTPAISTLWLYCGPYHRRVPDPQGQHRPIPVQRTGSRPTPRSCARILMSSTNSTQRIVRVLRPTFLLNSRPAPLCSIYRIATYLRRQTFFFQLFFIASFLAICLLRSPAIRRTRPTAHCAIQYSTCTMHPNRVLRSTPEPSHRPRSVGCGSEVV